MKIKSFIKMIIDIAITLLMIVCMSGLMAGDLLHEVFGSAILVLYLTHNILNWKWYANIFKGKYSAVRSVWKVINILSFVFLIAQGISGIVLSNYVFTFLNIESGFSLTRKVHLACGYWSLIFVSLHLEFHWSMIAAKVGLNKIKSGNNPPNKSPKRTGSFFHPGCHIVQIFQIFIVPKSEKENFKNTQKDNNINKNSESSFNSILLQFQIFIFFINWSKSDFLYLKN